MDPLVGTIIIQSCSPGDTNLSHKYSLGSPKFEKSLGWLSG